MTNEDLNATVFGQKNSPILRRIGTQLIEGPQYKTIKVDAAKTDLEYSKDKAKNSKLAKTLTDGEQALSGSAKRSAEGMKRSGQVAGTQDSLTSSHGKGKAELSKELKERTQEKT